MFYRKIYEESMKVKLWGVRGSLPTPISNNEYRTKIKYILKNAIAYGLSAEDDIDRFMKTLPDHLGYTYGGNTTCVSVTSNSGATFILDCGTGLRNLGEELSNGAAENSDIPIKIFITHTHWDHIQGLPFFKPLYIPGYTLDFYSPNEDLEDRLTKQMDFQFFPASLQSTASSKNFNIITPGEEYTFDDITIDCYPLKHPGGSYAYRVRENNKTFIFCTDVEITGETLEQLGNHSDFFLNADLMVLDSQYTLDESFQKFSWGHTCYTVAVNCGVRWNVRNLVLTHHEPAYSDHKLKEIHTNALEHRNELRASMPNIYMAREGMSFAL